MPRYLVERTFAAGSSLPVAGHGLEARLSFIANNTLDDAIWLHSYVTRDNRRSFCLYDAPSPHAVRRASERNGLPVDRITEVGLLDPHCLPPAAPGDRPSDSDA